MVVTGQVASDDQLEIIDQFDEKDLEEDLKECSHIFDSYQNEAESKSKYYLQI